MRLMCLAVWPARNADSGADKCNTPVSAPPKSLQGCSIHSVAEKRFALVYDATNCSTMQHKDQMIDMHQQWCCVKAVAPSRL